MKLCECGCGQPTKLASKTNTKLGHIKGQPLRRIFGHGGYHQRDNLDDSTLVPGTRQIPLTRGKVAIVDDVDFERLSQFRWHVQKCGKDRVLWYAVRRIAISTGKQATVRMHSEILNTPPGLEIDHKDGDGLNNTRDNLRLCTHMQNSRNRALVSSNTSGYKGVFWTKKLRKWRATISSGGKPKHIGYFADIEEAARAYDAAARELYGEFASPNFPDQEAKS